jgi:hypothetical protein
MNHDWLVAQSCLTLNRNLTLRSLIKSRSKSKKPSAESEGGVVLTGRFVESLVSLVRMHWDPEPFRAPGQETRPTSCRPGALTGWFMESTSVLSLTPLASIIILEKRTDGREWNG